MICLETQLNQLVTRIVEVVHPLRVMLFGSAARGELSHVSDLDILVVMPEGTHRRRTAQKLYREIKGISVPFDIVVATPSDLEKHRNNPGLKTILEEGRTIFTAQKPERLRENGVENIILANLKAPIF